MGGNDMHRNKLVKIFKAKTKNIKRKKNNVKRKKKIHTCNFI